MTTSGKYTFYLIFGLLIVSCSRMASVSSGSISGLILEEMKDNEAKSLFLSISPGIDKGCLESVSNTHATEDILSVYQDETVLIDKIDISLVKNQLKQNGIFVKGSMQEAFVNEDGVLISISNIYHLGNNDMGVMQLKVLCGDACGYESILILKKIDDEWALETSLMCGVY